MTSLLQRDVDWTPEARQEFLETIDEETDRLNALVGNLLDMSRLQAGALEIHTVPVGLDEVLPAALHSIGVADGSVRLEVPETLPLVLADRGLLERALANVISNAVRFSPPGSPPRVIAGVVDSIVDVRVVDCTGISQTERDRLFKPFQRLGDSGQSEGVGLGLAVAKGFLEAMGGEIEVDDTPGGGLTIVARLRGRMTCWSSTTSRRSGAGARHEPPRTQLRRRTRRDRRGSADDRGPEAPRSSPASGIDGVEVIQAPARLDEGSDHRALRPRGRQGRRTRRRRRRLRHQALRDDELLARLRAALRDRAGRGGGCRGDR